MTNSPFTSSPFVGEIEPIVESDDEIRAALAEAEMPPLLPALAYLTGDLSLLRDGLRPDPITAGDAAGRAERRAAGRGPGAGARVPDPLPRRWLPPRAAAVRRTISCEIMEFAVGGADMAAVPPPARRGAVDPRRRPARARAGREHDIAPDTDFRVVIIGAGMSGLLAAHRLRQAGDPVRHLSRRTTTSAGRGSRTRYPGCRVDNPNHNYSYSFAQRHDWPLHFSTQDVLLDYFRRCADAFGLRDDIEFGTEVRSATWSEADARWTVVVVDRDGREEAFEANAVISAVGQLNRPLFPDIDGRDRFEGPTFHSARWDHERRPARQAGRRHRHRRERGAVHSGDRAEGR